MLHLKERTQNIQCPLHYESIKFININANYPYEKRAMCSLCDIRELHYNMEKAEQIILDLENQKKNQLYRFYQKKDQQLQELILEANKITQMIIDQVQKQVSIIKEQVSKIERQFKECRSKLMPHSVFDNFVDSLRNSEQLQLRDIQEMGELLSEPQKYLGQFDQQIVEQLDGRIRLLKEFLGHPKQYDEQQIQKFRKSQDWINSISLNFDETLLLSGTDAMEKNIILWKLENAEWKFKEYIEGLNESISYLEFSKTTNNFITLGKNKEVTIWKCNSHGKYQQMQNLEESANLIRINSNDTIIGTCLNTKIIIYQIPLNWKISKIQTIEIQQFIEKNISLLAFNRNSKKLAVASGNMILIYEQEGKQFGHFQTIQQQSNITALDFCQSGEYDQLILSQKDKTIQIWEMKTMMNDWIENKFKYLQTLEDHKNVVLALSSTQSRSVFASSSYDNSIKLWSKPLQNNKWKCFQTIQQVNGVSQGQPTNQIIFSKDFRYLFIKQLNSVIEYHIV